jgi:hypothetical protein
MKHIKLEKGGGGGGGGGLFFLFFYFLIPNGQKVDFHKNVFFFYFLLPYLPTLQLCTLNHTLRIE